LLPFSISQHTNYASGKAYGSWICTNCGFYITTGDTRVIDPTSDIETGFIFHLRKKIRKMRKDYPEDISEKTQ